MRGVIRAFIALEAFFGLIAAIALGAIMLIATADVFMRYMFNDPFAWAHEIIRLYLVPIIVYFAVSLTFARDAHISVDLLQYSLSDRARHVCYTVIGAISACFFAAAAYGAFFRALEEFLEDDVLTGVILWPVWWSSAFVFVGSVLLTCRAAGHAVLHAASAITGETRIGLPALASEEESVAEVPE